MEQHKLMKTEDKSVAKLIAAILDHIADEGNTVVITNEDRDSAIFTCMKAQACAKILDLDYTRIVMSDMEKDKTSELGYRIL